MSETGPEYDETTAEGLVLDEGETEPDGPAQPFEEEEHGGDPESTEGEGAELDLEPADSTDHSDHSEDGA